MPTPARLTSAAPRRGSLQGLCWRYERRAASARLTRATPCPSASGPTLPRAPCAARSRSVRARRPTRDDCAARRGRRSRGSPCARA
eukprot:7389171-Prymnesium_polylepis.2